MKINDLLLLSGNDIPFSKARLTVHQPTIKEIAYIGEEAFFIGCEFLNFSKNLLSFEDRNNLEDISDFDIFMSMMIDKRTSSIQKNRVCSMMVLSLIFPDYKMFIQQDRIAFFTVDEQTEEKQEEGSINKDTFDDFRQIITQMFGLGKKKTDNLNYNPKNAWAARLANKMTQARIQKAQQNGEQKISVFSRYISILSVALNLSINDLMQYTVYQLFDTFERYDLKINQDLYIEQKLAGAKKVKEVENWMKEIH